MLPGQPTWPANVVTQVKLLSTKRVVMLFTMSLNKLMYLLYD